MPARRPARCGGSNAWAAGWTSGCGLICGGWRRQGPTPPADLVAAARCALAMPPEPDDARRWVEQSLHRLTDQAETHPSFADRAEALGCAPRDFSDQGFPRLPATSAAQHFFGQALDRLEGEISRDMQAEIAGQWHARHVRSGTVEQRLGTIATVAPEQSEKLTWEKVCLVLERDGPAAAEESLQAFLAATPGHGGASVNLGRYWLERRRHDGESLLRQVLEGDDDQWISAAGQILERHYRELGDEERLRGVRDRLDQFTADLAASQRERSSVKAGDRFVPHGLNPAELEAIITVLGACRDLHAAWLVRKELRHFPQNRLFVLVVRSQPNWWGSSSEPRDATIVRELVPRLTLPGQSLVIAPHGSFRRLARRIMSHAEAQLPPSNSPRP